MSDKKTLKVKLVRSPIGCKASHRATVRGLGCASLTRASPSPTTSATHAPNAT